MKKRIKFQRGFKFFFIRWRLHRFFLPFADYFHYLAELSRLSGWVHRQNFPFNDFPKKRVKHQDRERLYEYVLSECIRSKSVTYLEFGVAQGKSLGWWLDHVPDNSSEFHGFDTFTGLPESWTFHDKGHFSSDGEVPVFHDERCRLYKGLFQETLPSALSGIDFSKQVLIHLDADLYSSTLYVLSSLANILKENDILVFDEFGVPLDEFRAFQDFSRSYPIKLKPVGAVNNYLQVAFEVTG